MAGCGCGSASDYSFDPGSGVDALSNAVGVATWENSESLNVPPDVTGGIGGRSPYGAIPSFGGISFCRKCFLTWALIFAVLAVIFLRK